MPFFLLKLLGIGKWLREAATALLGIVGRYPWQAACIALCCLSLWIQHGKNVQHDGWVAEIKGRIADNAANAAASRANLAAQLAQKREWEAKSTDIAKDAQNAYNEGLADGRSRASAYANANRVYVRPKASGGSSAASSSGEGTNPGVPPEMPPDPGMVAIRETELQALVEWAVIGIQAHNNAVEKIEAGVAVPLPEPDFSAKE